ncbi:hypothetical protein [Enterococcus florum]|nr:hypothetical protein [Enterococcus florum]
MIRTTKGQRSGLKMDQVLVSAAAVSAAMIVSVLRKRKQAKK